VYKLADKPTSTWTQTELAMWLKYIGQGKLCKTFLATKLSPAAFAKLSPSKARKLGFTWEEVHYILQKSQNSESNIFVALRETLTVPVSLNQKTFILIDQLR
jgi:hypothetical protein